MSVRSSRVALDRAGAFVLPVPRLRLYASSSPIPPPLRLFIPVRSLHPPPPRLRLIAFSALLRVLRVLRVFPRGFSESLRELRQRAKRILRRRAARRRPEPLHQSRRRLPRLPRQRPHLRHAPRGVAHEIAERSRERRVRAVPVGIRARLPFLVVALVAALRRSTSASSRAGDAPAAAAASAGASSAKTQERRRSRRHRPRQVVQQRPARALRRSHHARGVGQLRDGGDSPRGFSTDPRFSTRRRPGARRGIVSCRVSSEDVSESDDDVQKLREPRRRAAWFAASRAATRASRVSTTFRGNDARKRTASAFAAARGTRHISRKNRSAMDAREGSAPRSAPYAARIAARSAAVGRISRATRIVSAETRTDPSELEPSELNRRAKERPSITRRESTRRDDSRPPSERSVDVTFAATRAGRTERPAEEGWSETETDRDEARGDEARGDEVRGDEALVPVPVLVPVSVPS